MSTPKHVLDRGKQFASERRNNRAGVLGDTDHHNHSLATQERHVGDAFFFREGLEPTAIDLVTITQAILVAEHCSFRQAASRLGIRQSVVSRRIRSLEDALGVSLFERHSGGVRVTAAGLRFLDRAHAALAQLDYAVRIAGAAGRGENGYLRIGISSSIAGGLLHELIRTFCERHPDVALRISEVASREHLTLICNGSLDIAFVVGTPTVPNCEVEQLWTERLFIVLPPGHALCAHEQVEWGALRDEHFILRQYDSSAAIQDYVIRRPSDLGHHSSSQRYNVGRETSLHLVALGLGVSLTSEATVADRLSNVEIRPITDNEMISFSGVWSPKNANPAFRRFLSLARVLSSERRERSENTKPSVMTPE